MSFLQLKEYLDKFLPFRETVVGDYRYICYFRRCDSIRVVKFDKDYNVVVQWWFEEKFDIDKVFEEFFSTYRKDDPNFIVGVIQEDDSYSIL